MLDGTVGRAVLRPVVDIVDRGCRPQVFTLERSVNFGRRELLASRVGDLLDDLAEFDLQQARQRQPVVALEQVRDATLARLAVDADDGLVRATDVGGVDRQVGDLPQRPAGRLGLLLRGESLLDRILMRAGKRGEHQFAGIRMARMNRQIGAVLGGADDHAHVGEIEAGVDALRIQVHRQRDQADVARALAVAEQAAFDAVGAGHDRQLGSGDTGTAIVVRMQAQAAALSRRDRLRCIHSI